MAKTVTPIKEVTILARVEFKNDLRKVVYQVLSSNGKDTYQTFLFNGKACSCDCPATGNCYHRTQCEAKEAARSEARKQSHEDENARRAMMHALYNVDNLG